MSEAASSPQHKAEKLTVVYDGECPFCSSYVHMTRLKDAFGTVELVSAREHDHPIIKKLWKDGFDLDDGMAAVVKGKGGDEVYYGADAVNYLTITSTKSGFFNRLMKVMFTNKVSIKFAYPFMRFGRNSALFVKGTKQLKVERSKD